MGAEDEPERDDTSAQGDTPEQGGDRSDQLLLDAMLGTLARQLRMCGYDAAYTLDRDIEADDAILAIARNEGRILLTRDRQLAECADTQIDDRTDAQRDDRTDTQRDDRTDTQRDDRTDAAHLLTERDILDQLRELDAAGFELSLADPPTRCGRCNGPLECLPDDAELPEYVPTDERPVWQCRNCEQCFWKGSHWKDVRDRLNRI